MNIISKKIYNLLNEDEKLSGYPQINEQSSMKDDIISFIKKNPNPKDSDLHSWAEKKKYNVHEVESFIYTLATKYISFSTEGRFNKSGKKEEDFSKEEIQKGIEIEREHTSDKEIAKRITMDHLSEFPNYYLGKNGLVNMEKLLEKDKK